MEDGDCQLLLPHQPLCDPSCRSTAVCVAESGDDQGTCIEVPEPLGVGPVHVTGLGDAFDIDRIAGSRNYQLEPGMKLDYPPCEEGDEVRFEAQGGDFEPFELVAPCIAPMNFPGPVALEPNTPLQLTWQAPSEPDATRVLVEIDISHHGGSRGLIECEVADTGSLEIAASLVDGLIDLGVSGFPSVALTRFVKAHGSTAQSVEVVLTVSSRFSNFLELPLLLGACTSSDGMSMNAGAGAAVGGMQGGGSGGAAGSVSGGVGGGGGMLPIAGGGAGGAGGAAGTIVMTGGTGGDEPIDGGGTGGDEPDAGDGECTPGEGTTAHFSFFVTSLAGLRRLSGSENGFGGDLRFGKEDGLSGADEICRQLAEDAFEGAGCKTWRAFLSVTQGPDGEPVNAADRIGDGPWYDRIGRLVAMNKTNLLQAWPEGADSAIMLDLPNEDGVPNHDPDGTGVVDNHNTVTGTNEQGMLYSDDWAFTCHDWTSSVGEDGTPMIGFSWYGGAATFPGSGWFFSSGITEGGCAPIINLTDEMDFSIRGIGARGGYGGFYCLALEP